MFSQNQTTEWLHRNKMEVNTCWSVNSGRYQCITITTALRLLLLCRHYYSINRITQWVECLLSI